MVSFDDLLGALYEIQGLSDPNHDVVSTSPRVRAANAAERKARMARIYDIACDMMQQSGYNPEPPDEQEHDWNGDSGRECQCRACFDKRQQLYREWRAGSRPVCSNTLRGKQPD